MVDSDGLEPKQRRFVAEYLKDQNGTQAAIRAGYSKKTAGVIAAENLSKPKIAAVIESHFQRIEKKAGLTAAFVLNGLQTVAERCMQGTPVRDREGNETGEWEFDSSGANRAFELLGKHLGVFDDHQGGDHDERNPYLKIDPTHIGQLVIMLDRELVARSNGNHQGNGVAK